MLNSIVTDGVVDVLDVMAAARALVLALALGLGPRHDGRTELCHHDVDFPELSLTMATFPIHRCDTLPDCHDHEWMVMMMYCGEVDGYGSSMDWRHRSEHRAVVEHSMPLLSKQDQAAP